MVKGLCTHHAVQSPLSDFVLLSECITIRMLVILIRTIHNVSYDKNLRVRLLRQLAVCSLFAVISEVGRVFVLKRRVILMDFYCLE